MTHQDEKFIPYECPQFSPEDSLKRSEEFFDFMNKRRSIREFSNRPVEKAVIENIIKTASSAPSGAHKQPWTFCAVSQATLKSEIRKMAEEEEYVNYHGRMSDEWLKDLEPFGTNHIKPFIEVAPYLIIVFKKTYGMEDGERTKNYYVNESVGIAVGMLLAAIHNAGLVALTHTPSPMNFLEKALKRPSNEKAFMNIPVGYPKEGVMVPAIERRPLEEISSFYED